MGASSSKDLDEPLIGYKMPSDRSRVRSMRSYLPPGSTGPSFDPGFDGYDFLIIFARPGHVVDGSSDAASASWKFAEDVWFRATPGDEEDKEAGVARLRAAWRERFRVDDVRPDDTIPLDGFRDLARELAVEILSGGAQGLQVRAEISACGTRVYCLARARAKALERAASKYKYKLRFKKEVDPGRAFWLKFGSHDEGFGKFPELDEDGRLYDKPAANELLEDLYHAGQETSDSISIQHECSARARSGKSIHASKALPEMIARPKISRNERKTTEIGASKVGISHSFPAQVPRGKIGPGDMAVFDGDEPGPRHWSRRVHVLERVADGVPVTNAPAFASWENKPAHRHLFETYATARGPSLFLPKDRLLLTKRLLDERLLLDVLVEQGLVPACFPLHAASEGDGVRLRDFQDAWVYWWACDRDLAGSPKVSGVGYESGTACAYLSRPWAQPLRLARAYFGEKVALYFAWAGYYGLCLRTPCVVCAAGAAIGYTYGDVGELGERLGLAVFMVAWSASYVEGWALEQTLVSLKWGTYGHGEREIFRPEFEGRPGGAPEAVASRSYAGLATRLNDAENYATESDYVDHLIAKKFAFEVMNNYAALAFTLFGKFGYLDCVGPSAPGCVRDARALMLTIFFARYVACLYETFFGDVEDEDAAGAPPVAAEVLSRQPDEGNFDDYEAIVLQMGLVVNFSIVLFIVPPLAAVEVLFQLRADAFRLCRRTRRPVPRRAETVGAWSDLMRASGFFAIFVNAGVVVFATEEAQRALSSNQRILAFLALVQALGMVRVVVPLVASSEDVASDILRRNAHVVRRHTRPVFADDDDDDGSGGGAEDRKDDDRKVGNVDRAAALRGDAALTAEGARRLAYLEARKTNLQMDLRMERQKYKRYLEAEDFREDCGVSYSKRTPDLALGMVTLVILEAHDVGTREKPVAARDVKAVVAVRDLRRMRTAEYEGSTFSLAPIKSIHASLVVELTDTRRKVKLATTAIALSDLDHQRNESLTLAMARTGDARDAPPGEAKPILYVKVKFMYSRLLPIRHAIYGMLEHERRLDTDISNLRYNKPTEHAWDWPEDEAAKRRPNVDPNIDLV
ncbi:intracellular chloride channel [Aureococcus anophagefferens]|nr:intracellular chloride channel [Aureococcus anophagefferens]